MANTKHTALTQHSEFYLIRTLLLEESISYSWSLVSLDLSSRSYIIMLIKDKAPVKPRTLQYTVHQLSY